MSRYDSALLLIRSIDIRTQASGTQSSEEVSYPSRYYSGCLLLNLIGCGAGAFNSRRIFLLQNFLSFQLLCFQSSFFVDSFFPSEQTCVSSRNVCLVRPRHHLVSFRPEKTVRSRSPPSRPKLFRS